jgi:hypothetical protein
MADVSTCSCKSNPTKQSQKNLDFNLDWYDLFEYAYLADLKLANDAGLKNEIQMENPFLIGN